MPSWSTFDAPVLTCCHGHLQVGTGVMVGLPGQTLRDLAGDIRFFKQMNANMIGMGPYITGA
jgi:biotin synthase